MASSPSYNPNLVENDFGAISKITADCRPAAPLVNRASQGLYPPGSTFKVVTASAALESNRFTPESEFDDPGYCIAYGKRVNNFDTSRPFGRLSLATALKYSVNSVFCNMGKALGAKRRDIMSQVLTESVTLSTFGGLCGIVLGAIAARVIASVTPLPAALELWSVVLGVGITAAVGLFFGAYPASRAARLDPIEALRRE